MVGWPVVVLAGGGVGIGMGLFGVGGSSVATPVLSLLGTSGFAAVASPLPATIPAAAVGAYAYLRSGEARPRAAAWSILGGVPGTVAGAFLSKLAGGPALLIASGVTLVVVGVRVLRPVGEAAVEAGGRRRQNRPLLVAASAVVGVFTGLLANGGGFLLVPLYLLFFGLRMRQAVGTSLLVVTALSVPTLVSHWLLGHVDWALAGEFTAGMLPGAALSSRLAQRIQGARIRLAFGVFLVVFGLGFTAYRLFGP